jgi:hypothetical protein
MSGRVSVLIAEDCLPARDTDYRALLTDADICMPAMGGIYLHKENLKTGSADPVMASSRLRRVLSC